MMPTPIRPRITLPVCNWGSSSRTVLIGTAKPMPMFPSTRALLMMAEFMPITSQRMVRLLRQLNERAVGERVASDDFRFVVLVAVLAVERDLDLGHPFNDMVV